MKKAIVYFMLTLAGTSAVSAQTSKRISSDLFGIFFEDISYAADGGLYAEMVQNRSFEYTAADRRGWHAMTAWDYTTQDFGYGKISVETKEPVHPNNPHYIELTIEHIGTQGVGIINNGYDGFAVKAGESYNFSLFAKQLSAAPVPVEIILRTRKGEVIGMVPAAIANKGWQAYKGVITAGKDADSAVLVILAKEKGKIALDNISLFPQKTFKNRPNGLRADLAQAVADLHPKFMRFPGGCLAHGDGLGNMYRWKNTIGPVEQRVEQRNIWNYHQTAGLGYFEFFQYCEDIGAKPLPVLPAAVSCQNSGGTWRVGGTGQQGLPIDEMQEYIQEVIDLVEYANGPVTSTWGAKRAAAGHPAPFNLQYIGIGNEDKITPVFKERFKMIYDAVKAKHPEITLIGTTGPFHAGEDYDLGWQFANELAVPMVDEHYYEKPDWFLSNTQFYDKYDRSKSKVYLGEYASQGNTLFNALAEAAYMTGLERNGDVVTMASYAPLLARDNNTSWNPNLIYFTNHRYLLTVNYYIQQLFSGNQGNTYHPGVVSFANEKDTALQASCVKDEKSGDVIVKIVNAGPTPSTATVKLPKGGKIQPAAALTVVSGNDKGQRNTFKEPDLLKPVVSELKVSGKFNYNVPAYSFSLVRIKTR